MTMRVLLASLAAGAVTLPVPAGAPAAAVEDLTIRSVTLRPTSPVVGPADSVRMVSLTGTTGPAGLMDHPDASPVAAPGRHRAVAVT
ncbi:hypothetical protein, partial [Streptosporangium sp. NPDC048865]|uniref:hypothetical protein n=1 Tax=Streptosporangium sp. NPDC048865 TaxID=3155766 RepID=UPI00342C1127